MTWWEAIVPPDSATREIETNETIEPTAIIAPSSQGARQRAHAREYREGTEDVKSDLPESSEDVDGENAGEGDTGEDLPKPKRSLGQVVRRLSAAIDQWVADLTLDLRPIWRRRLYAPAEVIRIAREGPQGPTHPVARRAYVAYMTVAAIARWLWAVPSVIVERPSRLAAVAVAALLLWPTPVGQAVLAGLIWAGEAVVSVARAGIL